MEGYIDPNPTRIDYMKWSDMRFIHAVVEDVRTLSKTHTAKQMVRHVRAVVTEIDDRFNGKLSSDAYHTIVITLQSYAAFVRRHDDAENENYGLDITQQVISIISEGEKKMSKNQLAAMVYRHVIEAMNKAEHGAVNGYEPGPLASDIAEDYASRIVTDVFGGKTPAELQTAEFVDRYYEMDPKTEDVLYDGTLVMDGMKILAENPSFRTSVPTEYDGPAKVSEARMRNRWATVESSKVYNDRNGAMLSFVAVYDDGVKRKRTCPVNYGWLVKKDSIPRIDTLMSPEGGFLEAMPTTKMVEFLKDRLKVYSAFDAKNYKIQTGIGGDVIPLEEYLIAEGVQAGPSEQIFTIVGPQGNVAFSGAREKVVDWLKGMNKMSIGFFKVQAWDSPRAIGAAKFLKDQTAEYEVWDEEGAKVFGGNIGEVLRWADTGGDPKYDGYSVSRVGDTDGYTLEQFVAQWGK